MHRLIIDGIERSDEWRHLTDGETLAAENFTVSITRWVEQRVEIIEHVARTELDLGVRLAQDDDPLGLSADIDRFHLVVIELRNPADGRFFSMAARLREHLHYAGELRVSGKVETDQLSYMQRCGINAVELGDGIDPAGYLFRYRRFYQSSTHQSAEHILIRDARHHANVARRRHPDSGR